MSFATPEKINKILERLRRNAQRQRETLEATEAEIAHWGDQLDLFQEKKGPPPKK